MNTDFKQLCTPAKIYFAIAVIACVISLFNGMGLTAVAVKLIFAFIWTFVLGWLCTKGFKTLSWFLVLLPYIIIAQCSRQVLLLLLLLLSLLLLLLLLLLVLLLLPPY